MSTAKLQCNDDGPCEPLLFLLSSAPQQMPWVPYGGTMLVDGIAKPVVAVMTTKKAAVQGQILFRHCPFCGEMIDPTIGPPRTRFERIRDWFLSKVRLA